MGSGRSGAGTSPACAPRVPAVLPVQCFVQQVFSSCLKQTNKQKKCSLAGKESDEEESFHLDGVSLNPPARFETVSFKNEKKK